jgi:hypothetical protein
MERAERVAGRRDLVTPLAVEPRRLSAVFVSEYANNAGDRGSFGHFQARDAAGRNGRGHDHAIEQIGRRVFGSVSRAARNLQLAVDPVRGSADLMAFCLKRFHYLDS